MKHSKLAVGDNFISADGKRGKKTAHMYGICANSVMETENGPENWSFAVDSEVTKVKGDTYVNHYASLRDVVEESPIESTSSLGAFIMFRLEDRDILLTRMELFDLLNNADPAIREEDYRES